MKTVERDSFERRETRVRVFTRVDEHRLRVVRRGDSGVDEGGLMTCLCCECGSVEANDYIRTPGLYRRWEIEHVVDSTADFNVEPAGSTSDGTELFSVYRRERPASTTSNCQQED